MKTTCREQSNRATSNARSLGVPLIDVNRQNGALWEEILAAIDRCCESGRFVLGPECDELERAVARYCGAEHAIGCASGSDALLLALVACGVERGDEVILPSFTFFATAGAVWHAGARPVFVDIDAQSFNIDPAQIEAKITPATKAIIPVHLYGQCAEMEPILQLAGRHGLAVIEDAAQSIGARYNGRFAGTMGDVGCLSFYPTKNLGGFGDGGMLITNRGEIADRLRLLRVHGMQPRYHHHVVGFNSRLDTLQAAVLLVKLSHLDGWSAQREANAMRYGEMLAREGLDSVVEPPQAGPDRRHVWNQYVVRIKGARRDALRQYLADRKIGTEIYYPVPLHLQECFRGLAYAEGSLPESERAALESLALPIFPELTLEEQQLVVTSIAEFFVDQNATDGGVRPPHAIVQFVRKRMGV